MIIKYLILIRIDITTQENVKWIYILGDVTIVISGIREFYLICAIIALTAVTYVIFAFRMDKNLYWIKLFHFLEGNKNLTLREIGIPDIEVTKEFIARYKFLTTLNHLCLSRGVFVIHALLCLELLKTRSYFSIFIFTLWGFQHTPALYFMTKAVTLTSIHLYIVCLYLKVRIAILNEKIWRLLYEFSSKAINLNGIKILIFDHNSICVDIIHAISFLVQFYTLSLVTCIPMSLFATNIILLSSMNAFTLIFFIFLLILAWSLIFLAGLVLAIVHDEANKSYKILCKLQWKLNSKHINSKIKVGK
jgi:hypothetical protein